MVSTVNLRMSKRCHNFTVELISLVRYAFHINVMKITQSSFKVFSSQILVKTAHESPDFFNMDFHLFDNELKQPYE